MKKYIIMTVLFLISLLFVKIPKYVELNNLKIIKDITIQCDNDKYFVIFKEVVPEKKTDGTQYKYAKYKYYGTDINEILNSFKSDYNNKIYMKKAKIICKCKVCLD